MSRNINLKSLVLFVVVLSSLLLSGCGGDTDTTDLQDAAGKLQTAGKAMQDAGNDDTNRNGAKLILGGVNAAYDAAQELDK